MLTTHPAETTDSFVLYIKGIVLLSKVKTFNLRFKVKYPGTEVDARDTPAFSELQSALQAFQRGIPDEFRKPVQVTNGALDTHLYMAHLAPYTCVPCPCLHARS